MILVIVQLALLAAVIIIGLFFIWKSIRRLDDKVTRTLNQVTDMISNAVPVAMTSSSRSAGGNAAAERETDDFEIILERKPTPPRQENEVAMNGMADNEEYDEQEDYEEEYDGDFDMFDTLAKTILKTPIFVPATNVAAKIEEIVDDEGNNEVSEADDEADDLDEDADNEVGGETAVGTDKKVVAAAKTVDIESVGSGAYSAKKLSKMRVEQLHSIAGELNLSQDGSKKVIIQRILDSQK